MKILIVGFGTIGTPLIKLFLELREMLGVEEVMFHKNKPELEHRGRIVDFLRWGAKLVVYDERRKEFEKLLRPYAVAPTYVFEEAVERADVVIDCTDKGVALKLKEKYYAHYNTGHRLFLAQGSEKGFGKPYAFSINDAALGCEDRFLQIVSCNTHQILCILKTLVFDYEGAGNITKARFYLGRRDADISQNESVTGVGIGAPSHETFGAHQAEDADRVLRTIGVHVDIHNIADILPQPFMHVVSFNIEVKHPISRDDIELRFRANPLTAVTYWSTNNQVFSEGRDRGHYGRILNQTVVHLPSLQSLSGGRELVGRCSTPQDGNAILSSVAATFWFRDPRKYRDALRAYLFRRPFIFDEV